MAAMPAAQLAVVERADAAPKAPQAVEVTGRVGSYDKVNGRWQIVFGDFKNGKAVYKRDGSSYYLVYNDCGAFQMAEKNTADCSSGFATQAKGVWSFGGKEDPQVKVQPVGKGGPAPAPPPKKELSVQELIEKENAAIERESNTNTFMGNLEKTDDDSASRLMSKMGAKIVNGM